MGREAGSAFLRVIAHDQICLIRLHVCSIVPPVATEKDVMRQIK